MALDAWDVIIVGGGSSGLPAAIFSAERSARVLLIDAAPELGGTLWVASGQISAAGTQLQKARGIQDSADAHYDDVMRISRGTANPHLVRLAVDHAAETFDWLVEQGFKPLAEHPVEGHGHEPYKERRYYWGEQGGLSVKDVLVPLAEQLAAQGRLHIQLNTHVVGLITDDAGAVIGARARAADGAEQIFYANNIVLTTGGYASNSSLFEELSGFPRYHAAPYAFAQGQGLELGQSVGGWLRGYEHAYCNFGTLFNSDEFPAPMFARPETFPERRMPWEIYVNVHGQRFIREDIMSVDAREYALFSQPDLRYWIIFDQAILEQSPPLLIDWTSEEMRLQFDQGGPAFIKAESLSELALKAGINADGLSATVDGFNYGVNTGNDFLGRAFSPCEISKAPFYALRMQGCAISSAVGLAVDSKLRVIQKDGRPIPNLYAAGELLGSSQTMGRAACGGMMVTPAMTFGRLLGQVILPLEMH